jgi:aryl-alcohol dehydrogenase-like predicted oxidoreductase
VRTRSISLQAYYSLAGRDLEREILPMLSDQQLALMVWSPLAGGFLSGKFDRSGASDASARRAKLDFPPIDRESAYVRPSGWYCMMLPFSKVSL